MVVPVDIADPVLPGISPEGYPPDEGYPGFDAEDVADAGGQLVVTDDRGRFTLDVPPGTYFGCYVQGDLDRGSLATSQCSPVDLGEDAEIHAAWGEGFGFWVEE